MSTNDRPYSRHYHELVDDPKFEAVFPDDHHYACWSRLLMLADQAWPASASLPATARKSSVRVLSEVGLIDLLPGGRFRMHGLQAEREQRSHLASHAATARWRTAERNADSTAERNAPVPDARMPRRDENRRDETSIARAREGLDIPDDVATSWEGNSGRTVLASGAFAAGILSDLCRRHTATAVITALVTARDAFDHVPSTQQLAAQARNLLDPLPSSRTNGQDDAAAREAAEIAAGRKRVEATLAKTHEFGAHAAEPNPRCPSCVAVAS
jgi:hypothetical protein